MATRSNPQDDKDPKDSGGTPPKEEVTIPAYLDAALRIPTSYPLGAPRVDNHLFVNQATTGDEGKLGSEPVPGFMIIDYVPTYGVSTDSQSALNRAAYHDFNIIRSKISGNRPYMPADAMIYRICNSSLRDLYDFAIRVYGMLTLFSGTNIYRPEHIFSALGLDYADWNHNAADLYQWLLNHESALLPFPTVPIGAIDGRRHAFNSCLFSDGEIESSQTYIMRQKAYYSYEKVDSVKGITMRSAPTTFAEFISLWNTMYSAFQNSSDVYIIAADIRRAFEDKAVTALPHITADYKAPYSKMDSMLDTIMNASCIRMDDYSTLRIYEDLTTGAVKCEPTFTYQINNGGGTWGTFGVNVMINHINSVSANPDAQAILRAVRMKPVIRSNKPDLNADGTAVVWATLVDSMGTEIVTGFHIGWLNEDNEFQIYDIYAAQVVDESDQHAAFVHGRRVKELCLLSNFDWHPPIYTLSVFSGTRQWSSCDVCEDVQNYIPISDSQIKQIHDAYLLSQFGV